MKDVITINMKRYVLVLTESELLTLLRERPEIWAQGLQRGKWLRRQQAAPRRISNEAESVSLPEMRIGHQGQEYQR